nr:glycosyltransferase [Methylomarinum sp. Ch1-1]MDP4522937.1 glycosyltransferase [Methylomarinum sp. Ch1-1]
MNRAHLPKQGFSALRRQWAERLLIPKVDGLICLTEHQRALYQQFWNKLPIVALSLGCLKFKHQNLEQRRSKRRVAYIGHLHGYKGSDFIYDVAKLLKHKNITLSCYGGHEKQVLQLRGEARELGLEDVLKFDAFVSPAELHRILDQDVSIGLVPLQDTFYSRYLTCPVKALDFLSHGLPVVASDLPSTREVLRETGLYCSSRNATEFAEAIEQLLDHSQNYQSASKLSYRRSLQLQWYLRAEKILRLLNLH